jgi:CheY-like chemotaxis protein
MPEPFAPGIGVLHGRHVLVIEDHEDTRRLWRTALEFAGAHVSEADEAERGLALVRTTGCDVILCDFNLRNDGRNGAWLLERVRMSAFLRRVPVVALTGRTELEADLVRAGFDVVLVKPVHPFDVVMHVATLLDRRAA